MHLTVGPLAPCRRILTVNGAQEWLGNTQCTQKWSSSKTHTLTLSWRIRHTLCIDKSIVSSHISHQKHSFSAFRMEFTSLQFRNSFISEMLYCQKSSLLGWENNVVASLLSSLFIPSLFSNRLCQNAYFPKIKAIHKWERERHPLERSRQWGWK